MRSLIDRITTRRREKSTLALRAVNHGHDIVRGAIALTEELAFELEADAFTPTGQAITALLAAQASIETAQEHLKAAELEISVAAAAGREE